MTRDELQNLLDAPADSIVPVLVRYFSWRFDSNPCTADLQRAYTDTYHFVLWMAASTLFPGGCGDYEAIYDDSRDNPPRYPGDDYLEPLLQAAYEAALDRALLFAPTKPKPTLEVVR